VFVTAGPGDQRRRLALAFGLALGAGCGEGAAPEPIPPMLSAIETQIFARNCTFSSCHGASAQEGLSLIAPVHAKIVGVAASEVPAMMRIAPGDPGGSYLLHKIETTAPMDGVRMPPDQPLPAHKIEAIRQWIAAGAAND
jgi:hypothetical protein